MKGLAAFVMRGRLQALLVSVACAGSMLFCWISAAVLALVTLRKGVGDGAWLLLWALLPAGALVVVFGDSGPLTLLLGTMTLAVVLRTTTGGSGTFFDLAVIPLEGDRPGPAVLTFLGDRIKIQSLKLQNGQVTVDLVAHGPEDPMCCPTEQKFEHFAWVGNKLERLGPAVDSY